MAAGYSIPESDALGMLGDAHSTNYAENREFFLNQNNPTNFERTWSTAYFLYKKINAVTEQTPFDQVMDFSVIQKLGAEPKYASQKNDTTSSSRRRRAGTIQGEKDEILTKTVVIHFFPNSWDLNKKVTRNVDGKDVEELYDPNVNFVVEEVGKLAGQYGAARIVIEGHTDGSMRATGAEEPGAGAVAEPRQRGQGSDLSRSSRRFSPISSSSAGVGWDRPADPADPDNHAKNRRVEIKVYPAEATAATK